MSLCVKCNFTEGETEDDVKNPPCTDKIPARIILYFLLLTAMISSFTMRTIVPITLLAMVKNQPSTHNFSINKLCVNRTIEKDYGGTLEWSIDVQHYILTSFYLCYIIAQLIGGVASQKFGPKIIIFYAFLNSSLCSMCVPLASNIHYILVIILQMGQGLTQGLVWPSFYTITSTWIPIHERSRFLTGFQGIAVGSTIGHVMAGYVINSLGWPYVFFIAGGIGFLWSVVWYLLGCNSPESHPSISYEELEYIQSNRGSVERRSYSEIPWKSMLLSLPLWAIAITSFGRTWLSLTIAMYGPLYLKTVVGLDIESNGLWTGLPPTVSLFSSMLFSYFSDKLVTHNYLSLIANRKLFAGISQVIPGVLSICFGYLNGNVTLILIVWCLFYIIPTASFASSMVNILDITPNFSGVGVGFVQIFLMLPSILGSFVIKTILKNEATFQAWQTIFNVAGAVNIISYTFYLVFATVKVQHWDHKKNVHVSDVELEAKDDLLEK